MATHITTQIHVSPVRNKKKYRLRHRRRHRGLCTAAVRAVTAAQLYLDGKAPNLAAAALSCGSCVTYVRAALILLKSENVTLLERVRRDQMLLLAAAKQMKQVAALVAAYRAADAAGRTMFAKTIGSTTLFDEAVALAL